MRGRVLLPPDMIDIEGLLVFLAAPIQGAPDWQKTAINLLHALAPELYIASPRRGYLPGTFEYGRQVDWETHYLRRAAREGVILFWLAREVEHRCDRAYAQTTRFELAEWKARHEHDGVRLVIGIEEGFTGARYICHRFGQDCPRVPLLLLFSLEEACRATVMLGGRNQS